MSLFLTQGDGEYLLKPVGYAALIIIMLLILFGLYLWNDKKNKNVTTRQLVFSAVGMALALVTSYMKLASLPFGGSITLFSMFFIVFIGYLFGVNAGLTAAVAYGILQLIIEPYIFHPVQVLLDYPLAFGMLGLSGFFANKKHGLMIGYAVSVLGRYICHVISGYIFFGAYAPEGSNAFIYTLSYNLTYILPEFIATMVLLVIPAVSSALTHVKRMATEAETVKKVQNSQV
ncbi:MAG: energy-coupled thiamine transporter ThiT [Clostridia bacterium]|nr:energy-coupled thiamine transporter ThiT [Clostridia bacterium]